MRSTLVSIFITLLLGAPAAHAARVYVDSTATGAANGTSWDDAYLNPIDALAVADSADTIWVAAGTYIPDPIYRGVFFEIPPHVVMYGGFNGTETMTSQRDPDLNVTTLSGDMGYAGIYDNTVHVVVCSTYTRIDGFTITLGNANGDPTSYTSNGAGAFVVGHTATIHNCRFVSNQCDPFMYGSGGGAGVYVKPAVGTVVIEDCYFEDNHAYGANGRAGGVWFGTRSNNLVRRCTFIGNTAGNDAGAVRNAALIEDCWFENNHSDGSCGAVWYSDTIRGSTFLNNTADGGGGAGCGGSSDIIENCEFIGNSALSAGALTTRATIRNSRFMDNMATTSDGGAIRLNGWPGGHFEGCVFTGNHAAQEGGAVAAYGPQIVGCTFVDNTAGVGGGALQQYSNPYIYNTIIWRNDAPADPQVIGTGNTYYNCIIDGSGGSGAGWDAGLGTDGGGNIDADPLFAFASQYDYRIGFWSPAHDAGDNTPVTLLEDFIGNARIEGGTVDIGAYEFTCSDDGPIVYVDSAATGAGDGSSWNDGYISLREAIAMACSSTTEIWVASGTYKLADDPYISFPLRNGVAIYGGFTGVETMVSERDWVANPTILSGELGPAGLTGNSIHVVHSADNDSTAVLDGFVIRDGNATVLVGYGTMGGGALVENGNPVFRNVVFQNNNAWNGGGIAARYASPTLIDVISHDDAATYHGGFLFAVASDPKVINATISASVSPNGAISASAGGTTEIINTIIWDSGLAIQHTSSPPTASYSLIEGSGGSGGGWNPNFGTDGGGNIDTDPLFDNQPARDLHLTVSSPAIDAGDNSANPLAEDFDGNPRTVNTIDMGAYEWNVVVSVPEKIPAAERLHAWPNPLNPSVTIAFTLDAPTRAELTVHDVAGRRVRTLLSGDADQHIEVTWDGTTDTGTRVASGVYFVRLVAGARTETLKLVVVK